MPRMTSEHPNYDAWYKVVSYQRALQVFDDDDVKANEHDCDSRSADARLGGMCTFNGYVCTTCCVPIACTASTSACTMVRAASTATCTLLSKMPWGNLSNVIPGNIDKQRECSACVCHLVFWNPVSNTATRIQICIL